MTDDRTLDALDRRARAAAVGVRTAVAERPVPTFDPDLVRIDVDARPASADPDRRRSRPVVAALAAAAAVLIVVAAVVALDGGSDPDSTPPADRINPDELGRYVLADPPDGYQVASVVERPEGGAELLGEVVTGAVTVYGPDAETPALGVFTWPADPEGGADIEATLEEMEPIEVAGRPAWEPRPDTGVLQGLDLVVEVDGTYVVLTTATPDREQLRILGGAVTVDGDRATLPDDALPDGWSALGEAEYLDLQPGGAAERNAAAGEAQWLVAYVRQAEGDTRDVLYVTAVTGDPVRARATMLATDETEQVTVRGHDAVVARTVLSPKEPGHLSVAWEERPGEIVQVVASEALGRDALLAQAEALRVVDGDEVAEMRRRALTSQEGREGVTVLRDGAFSDGSAWVLIDGQDGPGSMALSTDAGGARLTVIGSAEDPVAEVGRPLGRFEFGAGTSLGWAFGSVGAEVAEVGVRLDGEEVATATIVEAEGIRGWVAELPAFEPGPGEPIVEVVAYDDAGAVIDTRTYLE